MNEIDFSTLMWLVGLASIDLYAVICVISFSLYFNLISGIPTFFHPLGSLSCLIIFGIIYIVEHFVEKIPGAAIAWNWFHAIAKPITVLILVLILAFEMDSFKIGLYAIPALILSVIISVLDGKIWTILGAIPVVPIFVTIIEDIVVGLMVIKKIAPHAKVAALKASSFIFIS